MCLRRPSPAGYAPAMPSAGRAGLSSASASWLRRAQDHRDLRRVLDARLIVGKDRQLGVQLAQAASSSRALRRKPQRHLLGVPARQRERPVRQRCIVGLGLLAIARAAGDHGAQRELTGAAGARRPDSRGRGRPCLRPRRSDEACTSFTLGTGREGGWLALCAPLLRQGGGCDTPVWLPEGSAGRDVGFFDYDRAGQGRRRARVAVRVRDGEGDRVEADALVGVLRRRLRRRACARRRSSSGIRGSDSVFPDRRGFAIERGRLTEGDLERSGRHRGSDAAATRRPPTLTVVVCVTSGGGRGCRCRPSRSRSVRHRARSVAHAWALAGSARRIRAARLPDSGSAWTWFRSSRHRIPIPR